MVVPGVIQSNISISPTNYNIIVPIAAVVHVPNIALIKFNLHQNWAGKLYQVVVIYLNNQPLSILSNLHRWSAIIYLLHVQHMQTHLIN